MRDPALRPAFGRASCVTMQAHRRADRQP